MTETALVRANVAAMTYDEAERASKAIAASGFFKESERISEALVKVLKGQELGIGPVTAVQEIVIVKGKLSMSASLVAALIKRSGRYDYRITEHTDQVCNLDFYQEGKPVGPSRFSIDDAARAGLLRNDTWKNYPRNMLFSRALTNGARWYCADLFVGGVYTPDELGSGVTDEMVAVASVAAEGQPAAPKQAAMPTAIDAEYREVDDDTPPARPLEFDPSKVLPWYRGQLAKAPAEDVSGVVDRATANELHNTFTRLCGRADDGMLVRGYLTGNMLGSWQTLTNHEARVFRALAKVDRAAEKLPILAEYARAQTAAASQEIARKKSADADKASADNRQDLPAWDAEGWRKYVYEFWYAANEAAEASDEIASAQRMETICDALAFAVFSPDSALDVACYLLGDAAFRWETATIAQIGALEALTIYRGWESVALEVLSGPASEWVAAQSAAEATA